MPRIILLLLTLTLTSLCAAAPQVTVKLQEMTHHKSDVAPHVGHDCVRHGCVTGVAVMAPNPVI